MPRVANAVIARAQRTHPYLALLLQSCKDFDSARNELRWLCDYVKQLQARRKSGGRSTPRLWDLCLERARGRPLQYILGTQPFGDLEILCRKGVLIPRYAPLGPVTGHRSLIWCSQETENIVTRLADLLRDNGKGPRNGMPLRILDAGTGSGCIALLLYARLHKTYPGMMVYATDLSEKALRLTQRNLEWNIARGALPESARQAISIVKMDITRSNTWRHAILHHPKVIDILVSNPPYISQLDLHQKTERSVRLYEPRLALCGSPPHHNLLHAKLVKLARFVQAPIALFELDSGLQALAMVRFWARHANVFENEPGLTSGLGFDFWDGEARSTLNGDTLAASQYSDWKDRTRAALIFDTDSASILGDGAKVNRAEYAKDPEGTDLGPFRGSFGELVRLSPRRWPTRPLFDGQRRLSFANGTVRTNILKSGTDEEASTEEPVEGVGLSYSATKIARLACRSSATDDEVAVLRRRVLDLERFQSGLIANVGDLWREHQALIADLWCLLQHDRSGAKRDGERRAATNSSHTTGRKARNEEGSGSSDHKIHRARAVRKR